MDDVFERLDEIDPGALGRAFEAMLPELEAQTRIRRANTDQHKAILCAAAVERAVRAPEVRVEFARLPPESFDIAHGDRLETAAHAAWHAYVHIQDAEAVRTGVRVPQAVVAEAVAVKQRMQRVLAYNLDHLDDVTIRLASIRARPGYFDLVDDLVRLSGLYQEHAPALATDVRHYQAGDAACASQLAQAIYQVLGDGLPTDAQYWSEYLAQGWTLLVITYDEVRATGRWLFRARNGNTRFPSLYTIGRKPRRRKNAEPRGAR